MAGIITAIIFGFSHNNLYGLDGGLLRIPMGIIVAFFFIYTKDILVCIEFHFLTNLGTALGYSFNIWLAIAWFTCTLVLLLRYHPRVEDFAHDINIQDFMSKYLKNNQNSSFLLHYN